MPVNYVNLKKIPRKFHILFPLESIGIIENHPYQTSVEKGKLELCIRLSSTSETAYEKFNGQGYTVRYPNVALKQPDVVHEFTVTHPRDAIYFQYDPALAGAMRKAGLLDGPCCWEFRMTPEINLLLREAREWMLHTREFGAADRLDMLAMQLFEGLLLARDIAPEDTEYMDAKIHRIAAYFQLNFPHEIDLDELLHRNGISRRNFFRCWRKNFPAAPAEYLRELRFREAARLLRDTRMPVRSIATVSGFKNTGYFCALFKDRFGNTPLRYRKRTHP